MSSGSHASLPPWSFHRHTHTRVPALTRFIISRRRDPVPSTVEACLSQRSLDRCRRSVRESCGQVPLHLNRGMGCFLHTMWESPPSLNLGLISPNRNQSGCGELMRDGGELTTVFMKANRVIPDFLGKLKRENDGVEAAFLRSDSMELLRKMRSVSPSVNGVPC